MSPSVDWFKWEYSIHPLCNAPEPKRRFTPSKWERKKIVKLVRAIREGIIKFDVHVEQKTHYDMWGSDASSLEKTRGLPYIPPPKPMFPGHEEAYNPLPEYIPSQEEINSFQLLYEEDRPPEIHPTEINIDPESLKPKLPSRKDLRPYPSTCYIEYRGHRSAVTSISTEASGQWIVSGGVHISIIFPCLFLLFSSLSLILTLTYSPHPVQGSTDATVRIWEVATGRCIRVWQVGAAVQHVAWNPLWQLPILPVSVYNSPHYIRVFFSASHFSIMLTLDDHAQLFSGAMNAHKKDITGVAYHRSYPLFATCSYDCTAYVFHGMVYLNLNQNPLIVPLDILKGHSSTNGRGILDCKFHPRQPWLFTAGANTLIKLFCH
ncbi:Ribosome biogenesis protein BOP1-like protein [Drosera capensis]